MTVPPNTTPDDTSVAANPFEAALHAIANGETPPTPESDETPTKQKSAKQARREQKSKQKTLKGDFPGLRLTATRPESLFPDTPSMPTAEFVRQAPSVPPVTVRATHAQVADSVAGVLQGRVIRMQSTGEWMVWAGSQWEQATDAGINALITWLIAPSDTEPRRIIPYLTRKVTRTDAAALVASGDAELTDHGLVHAADHTKPYTEVTYDAADWAATAASIDGVRRLLAGKVESRAEFDANPSLLNTKGIVWELTTDPTTPVRCLGPLRPEHMVSQSTAISYSEFAPPWETSIWAATLAQILPDPEVRSYFQKSVGVSLYGGLREHKMHGLLGRGRNGKNKLLEAIAFALGSYARAMQASLLEENTSHPTEMMRLKGCRFAYISETGAGRKWDNNRCKYMIGDETMTARAMHQDYQSWETTHTLFVATNNMPTLRRPDPAFWTRFDTIRCDVRFWLESDTDEVKAASLGGPADPGLGEKLKGNAAAVLAWAIEGWRMYVRDGAKLLTPDSVASASREAESESTNFSAFLAEAVERAGDSDYIEAKSVFEAWKTYLKEDTSFNGAFPARVQDVGNAVMAVLPYTDYHKRRSGRDTAKIFGIRWTDQGKKWANASFGPVSSNPGAGSVKPTVVTVFPAFAGNGVPVVGGHTPTA